MDMISNLPPSIIETILCLLPIQEAARTSILSKEWRYRWIKIPKLEFVEGTFQVSTNEAELSVSEHTLDTPSQNMNKRRKVYNAINQVLAMHEGQIHEFTLSIETEESCVEIDRIIFQLARKNTVKKLTLLLLWGYMPSLSLFSLHQLTDLCLVGFCLDYQPTFNGFGSLTSLSLENVVTCKKTLIHLLSSCPLLVNVGISSSPIQGSDTDSFTIINLFECLPLIEDLFITFEIIECFGQDEIPKELSTSLVHLKYLFIEGICFIHKNGLPILVLLIRSSLNLEKLKLEILDDAWVEESERSDSVTLEDYSDIWLEHLNKLEITNMIYRKTELDFVKLILAKSPVLKKVRLLLCNEVAKDEELRITEILLGSPRASSDVQIIVEIVRGSHTGSRSVM